MRERRSHYDVTNTVHIADPSEVRSAVAAILKKPYPGADLTPLDPAFDMFARLYAGVLPGYHGCDTWYHDAQHSLDCALALARLLDGYERSVPARRRLGPRRAMFGIVCALFHDEGYIRRWDETSCFNGAEYTLTHVTRSGEFLEEHLPELGFRREAKLARELIHFTGYEKGLDEIPVRNVKDRQLGFLLGTADLFAQMSDRCYPEKCHSFLFHEFRTCGLAGPSQDGMSAPIYSSPQDLMRKTPAYIRQLFEDRLDGYFEGAYRYFQKHFEGDDYYLLAIREHLAYVHRVLETGDWSLLRRRPRSINAHHLRQILRMRLSAFHPRSQADKTLRRRRQTTRKRRNPRSDQFVPV